MLRFGFRYVLREEICLLTIIETGFMEKLELAYNQSLSRRLSFSVQSTPNESASAMCSIPTEAERVLVSMRRQVPHPFNYRLMVMTGVHVSVGVNVRSSREERSIARLKSLLKRCMQILMGLRQRGMLAARQKLKISWGPFN